MDRIGTEFATGVDGGAPSTGGSRDVAEHIARAAARLFAARGYDATSVREIVEAAGVTKPTLYYHFGSKEGLAQALVRVPMERLRDAMRVALDREADPVRALGDMLQAKLDLCREDPDRARFFYAIIFGPLATGLAAEVCRCGELMDAVQKAGVQRLVEAGVVAEGRAEEFFVALHGMAVVRTVEFLYRGGALPADLGRGLVLDLLRGFGEPGWLAGGL